MPAVLRSRKAKESLKLLGALLPIKMFGYLNLYALAKGITKTEIVKQLLDEWVTKHSNETEAVLLSEIAQRCNTEWKVTKLQKPDQTYEEFKQRVRHELAFKGLLTHQLDEVISQMRK